MDENSKKIVDMSLARITKGEVQREYRIEKFKRVLFVSSLVILITLAIYFNDDMAISTGFNAQQPEVTTLEGGEIQVAINQNQHGQFFF